MASNPYKLQLRSHKEIFKTRELAVEYINTFFAPDALVAEPTLYFYGDEKKPSSILAFGVGNRRVSIIDADEVKSLITSINSESSKSLKVAEDTMSDLISFITAVGVDRDTNKIANRVTFSPSRKNMLLADATSITHALDILSEEIGKITKDTFDSSDTIEIEDKLNRYTNKQDKVFSVKVSGAGTTDHKVFNNNIIGAKADGIYASVDLEYDEDRNTLTFITSGHKNGQFYDDVKEKVIKLKQNVQGVSNTEDIKHGKKVLSDEIEAIKDSIKELDKYDRDNRLDGRLTETISLEVEQDRNGGQSISGEVRLSRDNSIIVSDGGLSLNLGLDVDHIKNELILTAGNREFRQPLPDISVIKQVTYNEKNKSIVVELVSGKTPLIIPVADMLTTWQVINDLTSPIELTKEVATTDGGNDTLSASLKLRSTNNFIGVDGVGRLYVDKDSVKKEVVTPEIAPVSAKVDQQEAKIVGLEMRLEAEKGRLEATEDDVAELRNEVEKIGEKYNDILPTIGQISQGLGEVDTKTTTLANDLQRAKADSDVRLQNLSDKVDNELPAIKKIIAINSDNIRISDERLNDVKTDVITLRHEALAIKTTADVVDGKVAKIEGKLPDFENSLNTLENDAIGLTNRLTSLEKVVDGLPKSNDIDIEGVVELENPAKVIVTQNGTTHQLNVRLDISNHADNLLLKKNGTLFVSKDAEEHTGTWENDKLSLQVILNKIGDKLEEQVAENNKLKEENKKLSDRIQEVENKLLQLIDFGIYQ